MANWTFDNIPDQTGRTAIITGSNTGIGYEAALALAKKGAHVVLACRSADKGNAAVQRIEAEGAAGGAEFMQLDLADLDNVRAFAEAFTAGHDQLDLLINNAGVMMPPHGTTKQGFELQFGVNHLGHFALTGHLLPLLRKTKGSRVVVVSSGAHKGPGLDLDDLDFERRGYSKMRAYCASKLSNLLFAFELQRRLDASGGGVTVTAAHPGWTRTDLQRHSLIFRVLNPFFSMHTDQGALPTLRAATDPDAGRATYWGPRGLGETRGYPEPASIHPRAKDEDMAARLWAVSEERTGVHYDLSTASAA